MTQQAVDLGGIPFEPWMAALPDLDRHAARINDLPERSRPWAWRAIRDSQARVLNLIADTEGPESVERSLAVTAELAGQDVADDLRARYEAARPAHLERNAELETPEARARFRAAVEHSAALGQQWAVDQLAVMNAHQRAS